MSVKQFGSKNAGKSYTANTGTRRDLQKKEIFIGIVDRVVTKDSDDLDSTAPQDSKFREYVDNRNIVYVIPIDSRDSDFSVKAYQLNSHDIDMPVIGEAVLCVKTDIGNIIIDRLSTNAFGVNFELSDYLLSKKLSLNGVDQIEGFSFPQEYQDAIGMSNYDEVAPFFPKQGSRVFLGRNNQYLIFDHGARYEASQGEAEASKDGNFVKIGIRRKGSQVDSSDDPSLIVMGEEVPIQSILEENIESPYNLNQEQEPTDGIGVQSGEVVISGRRFVVIYSREDILLKGINLYMDFESILMDSDDIKLGAGANQPSVMGNDLVEMVDELVGILNRFTVLTPTGSPSSGGVFPSTLAELKKFKAKYLRKNNSPIHSNKVKVEK